MYICIHIPSVCVFNYVQGGCYIFNFLVKREYDLAFSEIFIVILITSLLYFPLSTLPKDAPFPISTIWSHVSCYFPLLFCCFLLYKHSTPSLGSSPFPSSLIRSLVNCYSLLFCSPNLLSCQCSHFTFLDSVVATDYVPKSEDLDLKAFIKRVCKIIFSEFGYLTHYDLF